MPTATIGMTADIGGIAVSKKTVSRTKSGQIGIVSALNAGKSGTLTTRTDNNTGTLTLGASHGIQTGDIVDIFWGDPLAGTDGVQYKVTVGTVSGTSVPIDLGVGANLPIATTAVIVCKRTTIDCDCDFDTLGEQLFVYCASRYRVEFRAVDDSLIVGVNMRAGEPYAWNSGNGFTNPITDEIAYIVASQAGDASEDIQIGLLYDAD